MSIIKPFRCIRPREDLAGQIAALPYDVYNRQEAKQAVAKNPLSFLNIDRAETQFDDSVDMYADCVYQKAHDLLWNMVKEGQFITDPDKAYYIYRLTMNGRSQTGITACASIDDYQNNWIKKHENTRADKEEDRIRHVDICDAQTGPIFLAYRSNSTINAVVEQKMKEEPLYDFTAEDGVVHTVWKVKEELQVQAIEQAFAQIDSIYIADGHHRAASAVKTGLKRREAHPDYTGEEEFNYFLSVLFPDDQLMIMDYNRVVKDLNGYSKKEFLEKISEKFGIEEQKEAYKPEKKGTLGMCLGEQWYKLTAKPEVTSSDPVAGLDVSILQKEILTPILGITDPKTDQRIDFVGGIRGLSELERRARTDMAMAFSMYPTSIEELFAVADAKLLMPPKSTWFEPKLRSGLFIHSLEEEEHD
ncbi:MAG: DUF1015 domain-containing protein [Lachnospiraceae bacterium]|nr:DUF1015 domain-containing protein [Lachnospiraceae bacterium]